MKEYEIVAKYFNACGGANHPITTFDEAELENTDDYIRSKHTKDFENFTKEVLPTGQILYTYSPGGVKYTYEFTQLN